MRGAFVALPTSAAPRRVKPPFRSAKVPSAEAPRALPELIGHCLVSVAQIRGFKVPPRLGAQGQGGHSQ